jgi:hypothetical protein
MVIALEKDDASLFLFASAAEAEVAFEAIDVEHGEYEFCDDAGQRFVGEMVSPVGKFRAGSYHLKPDGAPDRAVVASLLCHARSLERGCAGIESLEELRRHVTRDVTNL